jgi:hypothetical protein
MNATELLARARQARQSFIDATDVTDELDLAAEFAAWFGELDALLTQGGELPAGWARQSGQGRSGEPAQ